MYTFDELLALLPDCDRFPLAVTKSDGVDYEIQEPSNFIPPNLSENEETSSGLPPVVIISAPGAVGKSTLGKAIAFRKNALFWDLAKAGEVGASSLDGMLSNAVGYERIAEFREYMEDDFLFIVLDALDEGRIKVNEGSFRRLLENIGTLAKDSKSTRFVLLGRTRIAEEAWLVLSEMEVNSSIFSINPFNREQANQYVEDRISPDKRTAPFNDCRDLIFKQLDASVSGSSAVEGEFEFLQDNPARDTQIPPISFSIEIASNSVISFTRGLRDAFITVPCIVELGDNTPEFQIGPAVQINANTIRINSESLIVGAKTRLRPLEEDASPVILESLTCESSQVNRRPTVYETSKLLVVWPEAERHPWTDFRAERTQENFGDDQALSDVYRRFKRIATTFRSHSRGALARTRQKIGHRRVLQGALGQALLAQLEEDRILTLGDGGSRYFWNAEEADSHLGVTWQDLRQWAMPETLREYLSKFIREHPGLF